MYYDFADIEEGIATVVDDNNNTQSHNSAAAEKVQVHVCIWDTLT